MELMRAYGWRRKIYCLKRQLNQKGKWKFFINIKAFKEFKRD
jgi:hypothetical protein